MALNEENPQFSLKWSNHTENILSSLDVLLQSEKLVDVTLICGKESLRAHRVILSACSPFFQKIFAETPCNHPVVVLNEFQGSDVQALITFMYKGEVNIAQSRLQTLMKAAESLQIRGLADNNKNSPKQPDPVHAVVYEGDESGCGNSYLHRTCQYSSRNTSPPLDRSTPIRLGKNSLRRLDFNSHCNAFQTICSRPSLPPISISSFRYFFCYWVAFQFFTS